MINSIQNFTKDQQTRQRQKSRSKAIKDQVSQRGYLLQNNLNIRINELKQQKDNLMVPTQQINQNDFQLLQQTDRSQVSARQTKQNLNRNEQIETIEELQEMKKRSLAQTEKDINIYKDPDQIEQKQQKVRSTTERRYKRRESTRHAVVPQERDGQSFQAPLKQKDQARNKFEQLDYISSIVRQNKDVVSQLNGNSNPRQMDMYQQNGTRYSRRIQSEHATPNLLQKQEKIFDEGPSTRDQPIQESESSFDRSYEYDYRNEDHNSGYGTQRQLNSQINVGVRKRNHKLGLYDEKDSLANGRISQFQQQWDTKKIQQRNDSSDNYRSRRNGFNSQNQESKSFSSINNQQSRVKKEKMDKMGNIMGVTRQYSHHKRLREIIGHKSIIDIKLDHHLTQDLNNKQDRDNFLKIKALFMLKNREGDKQGKLQASQKKLINYKKFGVVPAEFKRFGDYGYGEVQRAKVFGGHLGLYLKRRLTDKIRHQPIQEDAVKRIISFKLGNKEETGSKKTKRYDKFMNRFVFESDNVAYAAFDFFTSLICLIASYFYLYMAAFRQLHTQRQYDDMFYISMILEGIFLVHMLLQFLKQCPSETDSNTMITDFYQISDQYLKGEFRHDIIPLIPLQFMVLERKRERLFWVIKTYRLCKGFRLFNVSKIIQIINKTQTERLQRMCNHDPEIANDMLKDNNQFELILKIKYMLKIFQLILMIGNASYIVGMMWYIICEVHEDLVLNTVFVETYDDSKYAGNYFITYYGTIFNSPGENTIMLSYYAFTTLSTVGFGDYHPISDNERILCSIIFLFGVTVFSYINSILMGIVDSYNEFHDDVDEGHLLLKFFGTLKKYNNNNNIKQAFREQLEIFFEYRWKQDKSHILNQESDVKLYSELPLEVRVDLFRLFFFQHFLKSFEKLFVFANRYNTNQYAFFGWQDQVYQEFMMDVLQNLEPLKVEGMQYLFYELEEINEVIFFENGCFKVGFEMNGEQKFVIKYHNRHRCSSPLIGAYDCTFDKKSQFIYKTVVRCTGYFIRKSKWQQVIKDHKPVSTEFKNKIITDFELNIRVVMNKAKQKEILKQNRRTDVSKFKFVSTLEDRGFTSQFKREPCSSIVFSNDGENNGLSQQTEAINYHLDILQEEIQQLVSENKMLKEKLRMAGV